MAGTPPVKGEAYTFYVALTDQSDTKLFKANPTLAAGDVKVSKDGGAVANPDALPDAEPDAGYAVRCQLTATEMNADKVVVYFHDAAGAEWCDLMVTIDTAAAQIVDPWSTALPGAYGAGTAGAQLGALTLAGIAAAVWDRLTTALTTVGSVGAYVLSKLGLITSATTGTIAAPVAGTSVRTYMGDDYLAEDGRALEWTVSSTATLTGGTVAVIVHGIGTFTGAVASETSITCDLTRTQSATITAGKHRYQVLVTQADSDVITVVDGSWESRSRVSAT